MNAVFPYIIAAIGAQALGYHGTFIFVAVLGVISIVLNCLFNPKKLADYDAKLRAEAGLPVDNVLYDRVGMEERANAAKKAAK
jgi:predicted MFS family arabinose efflux permease